MQAFGTTTWKEQSLFYRNKSHSLHPLHQLPRAHYVWIQLLWPFTAKRIIFRHFIKPLMSLISGWFDQDHDYAFFVLGQICKRAQGPHLEELRGTHSQLGPEGQAICCQGELLKWLLHAVSHWPIHFFSGSHSNAFRDPLASVQSPRLSSCYREKPVRWKPFGMTRRHYPAQERLGFLVALAYTIMSAAAFLFFFYIFSQHCSKTRATLRLVEKVVPLISLVWIQMIQSKL